MIAAKIFTFHNVSINSINGLISSVTQNSFTFHNVSINSLPGGTTCLTPVRIYIP